MECTVQKSKEIPADKALAKLTKFLERNAANQTNALKQQASASEFQAAGGDDEAAAAMGAAFVQHQINHISPDIYYQLTLMRDAMREEQNQAKGGDKKRNDSEDED